MTAEEEEGVKGKRSCLPIVLGVLAVLLVFGTACGKKVYDGCPKKADGSLNCSYQDLSGERLRELDFSGADFSGANLKGANLTKAALFDTNLTGANLKGANLEGADLGWANLTEANLTEANLYGADLERASLFSANLEGANLEGANLSWANLHFVNLEVANTTGAKLELAIGNSVTVWPEGFTPTTWTTTTVAPTTTPRASAGSSSGGSGSSSGGSSCYVGMNLEKCEDALGLGFGDRLNTIDCTGKGRSVMWANNWWIYAISGGRPVVSKSRSGCS